MPDIRDKNTCKAIARAYLANGRDKGAALLEVGYKKSSTIGGMLTKLYNKPQVQAAIQALEDEISVKVDYARERAVQLLEQNLIYLTERVKNGDVGAISARTAIIRELNAISNLHSSTLHTETDTPLNLSPDEAELYEEMARQALRHRHKGPKLAKEAV